MGGSVAQSFSPAHQGKTIEVRGRSPSVRTLADIADTGAAASSQDRTGASSAERVRISGKQTVAGTGVMLEPVIEDKLDFSIDKKMTGLKEDKIEDYLKYWTNQGMSKDNL